MPYKTNYKYSYLMLIFLLFFMLLAPMMIHVSTKANENGSLPLLTVEDVYEQAVGIAKTKGIVTAKLKKTIYIQDHSAAIALHSSSLDVEIGDEITITGELQDIYGQHHLQEVTLNDNHGYAGMPQPIPLSKASLKDHPSQLVSIDAVTIIDKHDSGTSIQYTAIDKNGAEFTIRDETGQLTCDIGITYHSITGIIANMNDNYVLIPRDNQDLIPDQNAIKPVFATPAPGNIPTGTAITLDTRTDGADIYYTTDGSNPAEYGEHYTGPIEIDTDVTIKAIAQSDTLAPSVETAFSYSIYDDQADIYIHDIQGEGRQSPMIGQLVKNIEGIVTYTYELHGMNYFHMQTPEDQYDGNPNTSEGIVVYTGQDEEVDVGNLVNVTGTVNEFYIEEGNGLSMTQINASPDRGGNVVVKKSNVDLPQPVKITSSDLPRKTVLEKENDAFDPERSTADFWRSIEGMRIEIAPFQVIAPQEQGELIVVTTEYETTTNNGGIRSKKHGINTQAIPLKLFPRDEARDFSVKTGDRFIEPVIGVVNFGSSHYKMYANLDDLEAAFEAGNTEPSTTTLVKKEEKLTIASYNMNQFSANENSHETPDAQAERIAKAFVDNMNSPDIIGVIDMQDNNGKTHGPLDANASESYARLITHIEAKGGPLYDYVNIDPKYNDDGGPIHGNSRVGFLYNPDRVTLMEAENGHGRAEDTVAYEHGQLTLNPGRIEPTNEAFNNIRKPLAAQFEFQGDSLVVVAHSTHIDSFSINDQLPKLKAEREQLERAYIINNFIMDIKEDNPNENVIILGGMADDEFSDTLHTLQGDVLTNLTDKVPEVERYTYIHKGQSRALDHILVSNHLANTAHVDVVHMNADFTTHHGRASDHDPILTQLDLRTAKQEEEEEENGTDDKDNNHNNEESKDDHNFEQPHVPETPKNSGNLNSPGTKDEGSGGPDNDMLFTDSDYDRNNNDDKDAQLGFRLPKTASHMYTILLMGCILVLTGGIIIVYRNRRSNSMKLS